MNREVKKLRTRLRKQAGVPFMTATVIAQKLARDGSWGLKELVDHPKAEGGRVVTFCTCCGPELWEFTLPGAKVEVTLSGRVFINGKNFK